ncbi:MAG: DUF1854 domain-containing protein [Armatimonadetes bacterium]|nr:DUF1854 domain-containing protein [Armatimonadota bacterium]
MTESEREQQAQHAADTFAVIDPGDVQFRQNDDGLVEAVLGDGSVHAGIRVAPAFPITRPNSFLYLFDSDKKELGLLVDPRRLDRESRDILLAQADQAYFMPHITRIIRVEERMGLGIAQWEVETDRGYSAFEVVSRSESVWFVGRDRIVIRDADGNRYLIEDMSLLDKRSRRLADLYI